MKPIFAFLAVAAAFVGQAASAAITFTYTSSSNADFASFSFVLPDNFAPSSYDATSFTVGPVTTNSSTQYGPVTLFGTSYRFYTAAGFGGFDSDDNVYFGPAVFTGPVTAPTFLNGTYAMDDGVDDGVLTISGAAVAGVPEPATWAMSIIGFGMIGGTLRRRQRTRVAYA